MDLSTLIGRKNRFSILGVLDGIFNYSPNTLWNILKANGENPDQISHYAVSSQRHASLPIH